MNIEEAAAFYYFTMLPSERLPSLAFDFLTSGVESDSLYLLASEIDTNMSNVGPLFEKCLEELSLNNLSKKEHGLSASIYYAKELKEQKIVALEFGYKIGQLLSHFATKSFGKNDLVYISYELAPPIMKEISKYTRNYHDSFDDYQKIENWEEYKKNCIENINKLADELLYVVK